MLPSRRYPGDMDEPFELQVDLISFTLDISFSKHN